MKVFVAPILLFALLVIGCKQDNPMVGTWKQNIPADLAAQMAKAGGPPVSVTARFEEDGTYSMKMAGMTSATLEGTYEVDGDAVTMKSKDGGGTPRTGEVSEDRKTFVVMNMTFVKE